MILSRLNPTSLCPLVELDSSQNIMQRVSILHHVLANDTRSFKTHLKLPWSCQNMSAKAVNSFAMPLNCSWCIWSLLLNSFAAGPFNFLSSSSAAVTTLWQTSLLQAQHWRSWLEDFGFGSFVLWTTQHPQSVISHSKFSRFHSAPRPTQWSPIGRQTMILSPILLWLKVVF